VITPPQRRTDLNRRRKKRRRFWLRGAGSLINRAAPRDARTSTRGGFHRNRRGRRPVRRLGPGTWCGSRGEREALTIACIRWLRPELGEQGVPAACRRYSRERGPMKRTKAAMEARGQAGLATGQERAPEVPGFCSGFFFFFSDEIEHAGREGRFMWDLQALLLVTVA